MRLIEVILSDENLSDTIKRVKSNKGAPGVDKISVDEIESYFNAKRETIRKQILEKKYKPQLVRRAYIPKANGKKRSLGIHTVTDRVIQQAVTQVLSRVYVDGFSDNSFGFRPNRRSQDAIMRPLDYLNEGYEWVIDPDIKDYFDKANKRPGLYRQSKCSSANFLISPKELVTRKDNRLGLIDPLAYYLG